MTARRRPKRATRGPAQFGQFARDPARAAEAGRKGGQHSAGNFAENPQRAAEAGRRGGQHSHDHDHEKS
ncbi:general stress protein [Komagataeibacter rhaeticus]|nr:general stress protein [Komagataeibacter rhaeticus]